MKVFLAGEGRDELGSWFDHPGYRHAKNSPGLIEALLTKLGIDFDVTDGLRWKDIPKFRAGDQRAKETNNVLGVAQAALDRGCDALIFVRDLDDAISRREEIARGIEEVRREFPQLTVCGGVAAQQIEAWVLAVLGERDSESHPDSKSVLRKTHGIETRQQKVDVVAEADLARIPRDADSLSAWLQNASVLDE